MLFRSPTETELLLVPSFLYPQAQSIGDTLRNAYPIPYTLSVGDSNKVTVSFGTNSLLPSSARRPVAGDKIRVFYRVGGGTGGNIVSNAINTTQLLTVTPLNNITTNIHVDFQNKARATGGQDAETSEHATTYAPLSLRTVQKAVTAEDYDILLNENSNVWTAVSYGLGNAPSNVYSKYGVNIQPTEVWNYVVTKKISPTTLTNPINTTDYNNLYWMSYYLDNRFNEIYSFRPGGFNFPNTIYTSQMLGKTKCRADSIYYRADTKQLFRNYFYLNSATDMINSFVGDTKFKVKVTTSYDTTQQFTYLSNLVVPDTIYVAAGGPGCYLGDTYCKYRVTKYIQSYLIGSADLSAGVDLSTNKFIKLNIDNIGDTVIDLTRSVVSSVKNVHAWEIAASINSKLNGLVGGSHPYGANYGDSTGVKGGATVLKIGSGNYLKIQGYNTGSATADSWISTVMIKIPSSPVTFPDATLKVFGTEVSGDTYVSFGYNRLTLIKNNSLSQFGNIVYENGSVTLGPYSPITFYTHYIKGDTLAVRLGTYFNYNFPSTDINYRPVANRVYNTVNITGDSKPNVNLSTFQLKFTSAPTISPSLYSINNSWNIFYATPAYITGPTIGDTVTIGAGSNNIKIGIDGKADVTVNLLADGGTFGKYYSSKMADTINAQLKLAYSTIYSGDSYAGFSYAFFDSTYKRITLKSPFASNASKVKIGIQSPGAGTILFGTVNTINNYAYVNGDYYLKYNATVSPTTSPCGAMELIKTKCADTNIKYSRMPDANFYTHFLWDRRSNQSTDEYAFQKYLLNQKMTGITNVFKPPIFGTFDIAGNIYYNQIYSFTSIKNSVETAITNAYGFVSNQVVNRDFNKSVNRSEIENLIHATEGVQYVTLTYFGTNLAAGAGDSTNKTNVISCDFDQIIVLAQNQFSGSNQIHGMAFNYYPYTS